MNHVSGIKYVLCIFCTLIMYFIPLHFLCAEEYFSTEPDVGNVPGVQNSVSLAGEENLELADNGEGNVANGFEIITNSEIEAYQELPSSVIPRAGRIIVELGSAVVLSYLPLLIALKAPEKSIYITAGLSPLTASAAVHLVGWSLGNAGFHWAPYLGGVLSSSMTLTMAAGTYSNTYYISVVSFLITPLVAAVGATIAYEVSDADRRKMQAIPIPVVFWTGKSAEIGISLSF